MVQDGEAIYYYLTVNEKYRRRCRGGRERDPEGDVPLPRRAGQRSAAQLLGSGTIRARSSRRQRCSRRITVSADVEHDELNEFACDGQDVERWNTSIRGTSRR